MVLLAFLLSFSCVVAFDFDNVKNFEDVGKYGKIEIRNAFGFGGTIAEYELKTNTDTCFTECSAEGTVTLYNEAPMFQDLNVKGITGDDVEIQYIQFFIKQTEVVNEKQTVYEDECSEVYENNGSVSNVCVPVEVSNEDVEYEIVSWVPYNYETLDPGSYEWKVEGRKGIAQTVDWIPYSQGIDLEEWAWWDSDIPYRQPISINNSGGENLLQNHTVTVSGFDTSDAGKFNQSNRNNFAVVCDDVEVDKLIINETDIAKQRGNVYGNNTGWGTANTTFMFRLPITISKQSLNDTMCYTYYGLLSFNSTKTNISNIALLYDDFKRSNSVTVGNGWVENATFGFFQIVNEQLQDVGSNNGVVVKELDVGACTNCQSYEILTRRYWGGNAGDQVYTSLTKEDPTLDNSPGQAGVLGIYTSYGTPNNFIISIVGDGSTVKSTTLAYYVSKVNYTERIVALNDLAGDYDFYKNETLIIYNVANNDVPTDGNKTYFKFVANRVGDTIDYVMVRRLVSTQPTITFGAEETVVINYVDNATLAPDPAYATSDLNCTGEYMHSIGQGNFTFTWTKNGAAQPIYTSGVQGINQHENITSPISVTETLVKTDNWTCSIFANNGSINDNETILDSVIISNTAPTTPTIVTPVTSNQYNKYISINCSGSTDADTDPINYSFEIRNQSGQWNTEQANYSDVYNYLPPANFTVGFRCRAYDGEAYSGNTTVENYTYDNSMIKAVNAYYIGSVRELNSHLLRVNITFNKYTLLNLTNNLSYIPSIYYDLTNYINGSTSSTIYRDVGTFNRTLMVNVTTFAPNINETVSNFTVHTNYGDFLFNFNVTQFRVYNCTGSNATSMAVLNLTFLNEHNDARVNSDLDANFFLWGENGTKEQNSTFTLEVDGTNNTLVCIDGNESYLTYAHMRYVSPNYDYRDYYLINATLNNDTEDLNLYLLNITLATGTGFEITDSASRGLEDFYVLVQKYYVGENAYKTVAMGKTDDNGEDYIYLRHYDTWYKFIIQNDTVPVYTSENRKITTTTLQFTISESQYFDYLDDYADVSSSLTYNNITDIITATFTTGDGTAESGCLTVIRRTASSDDFICNTCVESAAGSITCPLNGQNGTYLATFYVHGSPEFIKNNLEVVKNVIKDFTNEIGIEGVVFSAVLIIAISTTALVTGSAAFVLIVSLVALIISAILGFLNVTFGVIIGIVVIGGIIFALIKK